MVYPSRGQLQHNEQPSKKLKLPNATVGRSLGLNSQVVMESRNAACSNIGLTFSGGSTVTFIFKFADPPPRITG